MAFVSNDLTPVQPKILLVDDREDNLLSIQAILEPDGYQFFRAYSGQQALKILLHEFDFAMILMDVKMPGLNGFETATLIYEREKLRHIPIIFITANNYGDENIFKGYKAGGIDYIFKPINPEVLRAKVVVFIDLYRKNAMLLEQEQMLEAANKELRREIGELNAAGQEMTKRNGQLQREVFALESLVLSSQLSINNAEFKQTDLGKLFRGFLEERGGENEESPTVLIDSLPELAVNPALMRSLFRNLIQNAIRYSKQDMKPIIKIRRELDGSALVESQKKSLNGKYCSIVFEDNGLALDHRSNGGNGASETNDEPDDDSGLVFCRKIMEKHDGFIFAKREMNVGSIFVISFP